MTSRKQAAAPAPDGETDARETLSSKSKPVSQGFLADIVLNAIEPGANQAVLIFLNIVFVLLLVTLAGVTVFTGINIHVIFLAVIALGLMVGFNL